MAKTTMRSKCLVCSKSINVTLNGRSYRNDNYFGRIKLPSKPGKYKKTGTTKIGKLKVDVAKWTGKEKEVEYWECNKCFEEAAHESWLEDTIKKLFGKRCKDYVRHCPVCDAWFLYDTILEDARGEL